MITPARVLVVDELPLWNTGAVWHRGAEFVSDDAAIVAGLLARWGVQTELVGTALGDDEAGRRTVRMLQDAGVSGRFELRENLETPFEVNVSDSKGGRTYLWNRRSEVLETLAEADTSAIDGARLVYADWYDAPHNFGAIEKAGAHGVPLMLNLEHGHTDSVLMETLAPHASVCQAVTDAAQVGSDAQRTADLILSYGVDTALVTLASGGAVGASRDGFLHVEAPRVPIVDTCAAGATFSAYYIVNWLRGADLETTLRSAVAAASLKCTVVGPVGFPEEKIIRLAETLEVRLLA